MNWKEQVYLAARYSRRLELCAYKAKLEEHNYTVQARWLDGSHQITNEGMPVGENGIALVEGEDPGAAKLRSKFATDDFDDVTTCDICIAFTEPPRSNTSRGGRHVELGIALGLEKTVYVIGPRENIFCWLPQVHWFETWELALQELAGAEAKGQP